MNRDSKSIQSPIDFLLDQQPFKFEQDEKDLIFDKAIKASFQHHISNNELFRNFCFNQGFKDCLDKKLKIEDYPYLPVNIFKNKKLYSVPDSKINTVLNSSATSGSPSTIVMDSLTSRRQTIVSTKVMSDYLGKKRRPFLILDENPLKAQNIEISARAAATRGFLMLSSKPEYFIQNENNKLKFLIDKFREALQHYETNKQDICIFGFTYILYNHVIKKLKEKKVQVKLPNNTKIAHIGGWKKLESEKVSKTQFLNDVSEVFGIKHENIFDFYGFTEQMGLLYVSTGNSPKTVPLFSQIIIRDYQSLEPVPDGEEGLIQILTPIPHSYPGISVLTEDVGVITGRVKDNYGRFGTQFEILGRAKKAETRGCGDIMADYVA